MKQIIKNLERIKELLIEIKSLVDDNSNEQCEKCSHQKEVSLSIDGKPFSLK